MGMNYKIIPYLVIILKLMNPEVGFSNDSKKAKKHIQKALLKTEIGRKLSKKAERFVKEDLGVPSAGSTIILTGLAGAVEGKISTNRFKNLKIKGDDWNLRPNIEHEFGEGTAGSLDFNVEF